MAENGMAGMTIDAVAERADVAVQTIYNRVGGRNDLLAAVADQALAADRAHMDRAYDTDGTPLERIETAARAYTEFALRSPNQFRLLAFPPENLGVRQRIEDLVAEQNAKLTAAIRDGIADGSVRASLDPESAATALWAMMNGLLTQGQAGAGHQVFEAALDLLRSGIEQPGNEQH